MPPKKKGGKKAASDDWEGEALGEAPPAPVADDGENDDGEVAGGLMAVLNKRKEKRKKKGIVDDFVEGEDALGTMLEPADLADKAPAEATVDDEFALPDKKGQGKQQTKQQKDSAADEMAEDGRMLTKAEKEKLRKEKEKQRKKELVWTPRLWSCCACTLS
jgi:translation initiation factor 5B